MDNSKLNDNLFKLVDMCQTNNDGNTIISGISIKMALALLLNGADGQSKDELVSFLGKDRNVLNEETKSLLQECGENLKLANAFWFASPNKINEEYRQIIKNYQNAEINVDDFSSKETLNKINNWVNTNTNGLIKNVLNKIDDCTSVLINTLYFNAQWTSPFSEYLTHNETFYGTEKNNDVQMMKTTTKKYFENEYAKGFNLYYENLPYEFIAILPNEKGDFKIEQLDINNLNSKEGNYKVNVDFPRLNIEYSTQLEKILPSMGIIAPFTQYNDFVSMLSIPQIVSQIIHKTNFKLDEKGTEAAAATVILMSRGIARPLDNPIEINLTYNRPFAFIIRHTKTKDLLFVGKINNL